MKICFVSQHNDCRSVLLELFAREWVDELGFSGEIAFTSAGLTPGGGLAESIHPHLISRRVPEAWIKAHKPRSVESVAPCDIWAVAEPYMATYMKDRLADCVKGAHVVTVRSLSHGVLSKNTTRQSEWEVIPFFAHADDENQVRKLCGQLGVLSNLCVHQVRAIMLNGGELSPRRTA